MYVQDEFSFCISYLHVTSTGGSRNFHKWGPTDCLRGARSSDSLYKQRHVFPKSPPPKSDSDQMHRFYVRHMDGSNDVFGLDLKKKGKPWKCNVLYYPL